MNNLQVALVQRRCGDHPAANLIACENLVREAAAGGARLVLLPELHNSCYFCQVEDPNQFDLAESVPGPTSERLAALAAQMRIVIVASLFERRAAGLYHNTAVVLDPDRGLAGIYRKMHIPDDPGYYEKFYFTPGDLGFRPIDTTLGRLGVLVCWDQWFPEAARLMALHGAELLLYPTAIGWAPGDPPAEQQRQFDAWRTVQRGHAVANGLAVLTCNRTGLETDPSGRTAGIQFWGGSFVCGPQGEILAEASASEALLQAEITPARTEQIRRIWPFLRDRRIDAYSELDQRFVDAGRKSG